MNSPIFPSLKRSAHFSAASICSFLLWILPPQPAAAETKSDDVMLTLQTLADFHSAEQTVAQKPIMDADASYRSKLERIQKTAQDAGNLKSVLAAKQSITELDAGRPPLVSDDAEVAAIQKTYIAQRQKAEAESAKALAKVDQDYLATLKKLVADLTKAGKIEQAMEVQAKVDGLAAAATPQPGAATMTPGAEEIEIWKKKALDEFPALKQPESELANRVKTLSEKKKAINPSFFKNPQWPYLLAQEASLVPSGNATAASPPRVADWELRVLKGRWNVSDLTKFTTPATSGFTFTNNTKIYNFCTIQTKHIFKGDFEIRAKFICKACKVNLRPATGEDQAIYATLPPSSKAGDIRSVIMRRSKGVIEMTIDDVAIRPSAYLTTQALAGCFGFDIYNGGKINLISYSAQEFTSKR